MMFVVAANDKAHSELKKKRIVKKTLKKLLKNDELRALLQLLRTHFVERGKCLNTCLAPFDLTT